MSAQRLLKYNPQKVDPKELEAVTIGREELLARLERRLRREASEAHPQHLVLVGPRGIGKTHLLKILYHRCLDDPDLSQAWLPLLFPEELHDVVDLRTFYRRVLRELNNKLGKSDAEVSAAFSDVDSGSRDAARAAAFLKDFASKGRRLLLMIDNLDRVLGVLSNSDQKMLRDVLMNQPFCLIIGGSLTVFREHTSPVQVFHHLFEMLSVPPLAVEQMSQLLRLLADRYGPSELAERLNQRAACPDALWYITGGSPRLAIVAHEIASLVPERMMEVTSYLEGVIDNMTPYFQDRLNQIPSRERQLVDALISGEGPLTPAELSESIGLSAGQVRVHLSRLGDRGIVAPTRQTQQRRTKRYDLTERLFRSWYYWRLGEPERQHVLLVVEILEAICTIPELRHAVEELQTISSSQAISVTATARSQQAIELALERMDKRSADTVQQVLELLESGEISEAIRRLEEARIVDPENPVILFLLGFAYYDLSTGNRAENLNKAIECYQAALRVYTESDSPAEWAATQNNLGIAYADLPTGDRGENLRKAIESYQAALRVCTENDYLAEWAATQNNLGNAYRKLPTGDRGENLRRAIEYYQAALRVYTENDYPADWAGTQNNLGNAYADLPTGDRGENLRKAIECCEAALRIHTENDYPVDWAMTQNNLGRAYCRLPTGDRGENLRKAIDYCEAALRVYTERDYPAEWATVQNNLGSAYRNLPTGDRGENLRKAIECYETTLRVHIESDYPADWAMTQNNLGNAYADLPTGDRGENLRKAIECYEAARPIAEQVWPWRVSGLLGRLVGARTDLVQHSLSEGNRGDARRQAEAALSEIGDMADEAATLARLLYLFRLVLIAGEANLAESLLEKARDILPERLTQILFVVDLAVKYQKTDDPEVLDKLSPEIREAVEALLKDE